jgi:hypothetical protein
LSFMPFVIGVIFTGKKLSADNFLPVFNLNEISSS